MWVAGLEEAPDTCFANHHLPRSPEEFGEYSSPKPLTSSQRLQAELLIRVHLQLQKASAAEGRIPAPLPLFVIECLYLCSMREGAATPRISGSLFRPKDGFAAWDSALNPSPQLKCYADEFQSSKPQHRDCEVQALQFPTTCGLHPKPCARCPRPSNPKPRPQQPSPEHRTLMPSVATSRSHLPGSANPLPVLCF